MESLASAIEGLARCGGTSAWPGLRLERPTVAADISWPATAPPAIGVLVRAHEVVGYRVLRGDRPVETSALRPALWLILPLDSVAIRQISAEIAVGDAPPTDDLCALDDDLSGSILRFLRACASDPDRAVLGPLYAREIAYRVLQGAQGGLLLHATRHRRYDPVADTIDYITGHLADPMTVETLSQRVHLSPSAFTRAFRETTGRAPYQFVKNARLLRARELLAAGHGVSTAAHAVGFVSISHFIRQFRTTFGVTPGAYATASSRALRPAV